MFHHWFLSYLAYRILIASVPLTYLQQCKLKMSDQFLPAIAIHSSLYTLTSSKLSLILKFIGEAPVIPDCAVITGSSVVFPNDGDTLPPGCDLCIRAGTSVILDCGVSAGQPPISYRWTLNGTLVSTDQRLRVREEGTYSCSASNQDNDPAIQASVLFCTRVHSIATLYCWGRGD